MTEVEWLACEDPAAMLLFLRDRASERKLRLLACACGRRIWGELFSDAHREAVALAEAYVEGAGSAEQLDRKRAQATAVHWGEVARLRAIPGFLTSPETLRLARSRSAVAAAYPSGEQIAVGLGAGGVQWARERAPEESAGHVGLVRDLFGNPCRPVALDRAWLTPAVVSLAQAAYDERLMPSGELDVARLAVLADALEEAGCADDAILSHLRSAGPHVRGCWVIDLVLGKQ